MNKDERKRLADKLKELRIKHGYRQADISAAIDIRQATYSNYELGKRTPGSVILYKIANFYGMSADELLKLSIPLDETIFFDAPETDNCIIENENYLDFSSISSEKVKKLLQYFSGMNPSQQDEILHFAEFILSRSL